MDKPIEAIQTANRHHLLKLLKMKHSLFLLLAAALLVACKPQQNVSAQQTGSGSNTANQTNNLVQLETGGCRGFCPMYKLTFRKDGSMVYMGIRNVEKVGPATIRLSTEEYSQLLKELNKADLWQYQAEIPSTVVDAPVHTFTVYDGAKSHSVKGTAGIPQPIMDLELLMQNIVEAHGFPVKKGVDPAEVKNMKGQMIVKFEMDVNAKEFCNKFSDLKVRIVKHLFEDNTWIIGFDPKEITEEQFSALLLDMEGVLTVEPNKQIKSKE